MRKTIFITSVFSLLCLGLQGCSSCTPKSSPVTGEENVSTAPADEAQPTAAVQPEQKSANTDPASIGLNERPDAGGQGEQERSNEETAPVPSDAEEITRPFDKDEFITTPNIPDAAKYAYAIRRALGCSVPENPMDTYSDDDIFEVHYLEDCEEDDRDDKLLKKLIENKSDINAYNANGRTLLSLSLFHAGSDYELGGETEVFDLLLKSGADITKADADGSTILMRTDFIKTAEKYIAAGGDIHAKNKYGKTALDIQREKLSDMVHGEDEDGNHYYYFYEELTMGCLNEEAIEEAENKGKEPPECITYADVIKDNVREIIKRIKK